MLVFIDNYLEVLSRLSLQYWRFYEMARLDNEDISLIKIKEEIGFEDDEFKDIRNNTGFEEDNFKLIKNDVCFIEDSLLHSANVDSSNRLKHSTPQAHSFKQDVIIPVSS